MKFIVMNSKGQYGVESHHTGFGGNGTSKLYFTNNINEATLFQKMTYDKVNVNCRKKVIVKLSAEETREVTLIEEKEVR